MKNLLLGCIMLILASCGTSSDPSADTGGKLDAALPVNFLNAGCKVSAFKFDLSSIAGGGEYSVKYTYDNLNRVTKIDRKAGALSGTTTYAYTTGKIKVDFDSPVSSQITTKGTVEYLTDNKNRIVSSTSSISAIYNGTNSGATTTKYIYTYDADGQLKTAERTEEKGEKYLTNFTWSGGNLIKSIETRTAGGTAGMSRTQTQDYSYDAAKSLGTWDGGIAGTSTAGISMQPGFFGKANKNLITKIVTTTHEVSTNALLAFDYKLIIDNAYTYQFDAKGYPTKFTTKSTNKSEGKLPLGFSIPQNVADATGTMSYACN